MKELTTLQKIGALTGALALVMGATALYFLLSKEEEIVPPVAEPEGAAVIETIVTEIGTSVEGRAINAYTYGTGDTHLLFVGGIHGGYEWNSVFLAYRFMDYMEANPAFLPDHIKITVVPVANPDGLFAVVGKAGRFTVEDAPDQVDPAGTGRFNANGVDLNRNFDCKWKPESAWRGATVSAGQAPFSEPEAAAIRDLVQNDPPDAAIFWHSQAGAVYGSECLEGILPVTLDIMNAYAAASGYAAVPAFTSYEITGDVEGWLASIGVPAITVELTTHENIEWDKNLAGVTTLFEYFTK